MIRMTLALLVCIGVTMVVAGREPDVPMGSDDPDLALVDAANAAADPAPANRLALDDEAGAVRRALQATAAPEPAPEPATIQTASLQPMLPVQNLHYVTGNRVNVRSGPSTANAVVDQVVLNQEVEVLDETPDGWKRILILDTGTEAYIFGRFLAPVEG